jgi:glycosyltransferase involved in cell wall biosynthesis
MKDSLEDETSQPAVTILMASYGRLDFLKDAVNSALNQKYSNYRIVIVDDGSGHAVVEWLQALESSEPCVNVAYQTHQGVAAARANGLEQAETDLVCILDSDDRLAENALELLVAAMSRHSDIHLAFANIREIRANGEVVVRSYCQYDSTRAMTIATLLKLRLPFKHSGSLFRRHTALALGSYDTNLPCKIDVDLYLKFLQAGYLPEHVDKVLVDFRMHKNSISIDRLAGIRVWINLINRYGPANPIYRLIIMSIRVSVELLKRAYMEIKG